MTIIMLNGQPVTPEQAMVSVQDRGFRYGDGVFETIAIHKGVPYQFAWHMKRMERGLAAARINCDPGIFAKQCRQIISANKPEDGVLRIQVTRGVGSRGYLPDPNKPQVTSVIETMPLPAIPTQPVTLWLSGYERISERALPAGSKFCQGLNSTLARMDAQDNDCFDALQLNHSQQISETSSANIFWLKDGTLFTPSLECGAFDGSTRAALIRLSPYPVVEVAAGIDELSHAQGVFISNSVWKALAVKALQPGGMRWDSQNLAAEFNTLLLADRDAHSQSQAKDWK